MAILSKDDFMSRLKTRIGDNQTDDDLALLEDFTDTYNDLESRATGLGDSAWQQKYDDLDKSWREKYKARFFDDGATKESALKDQRDNVEADGEVRSFEELFDEREG